jgi:hypothetical protein
MLALSVLAVSPASAATGDRPSVPRHVTASAGNHMATVTFGSPSNGGSRISDFYIKVYPRTASDSAIRKCRTTRCEVLGLSDSKSYDFRVAAVNKDGVGPYSAASNVISPKTAEPTEETITFVANGGSGSMPNETEPYDASANLTINAFTFPGHVFKDWATAPSGAGETFTNGELVKLTGSVTLYAQWSVSADLVTVTFNANSNGAAGAMAPEVEPYDVAIALTANAFTVSGSTFEDWSTTPSGTGTSFANGGSYPFTSNVTLYAQWTANAPLPFIGSTSPNWSGYVLPASSNSAVFTYVSGEWTVPTLNCPDTPNNRSATWVGTGGFGWAGGGSSGVLLQTGTEDDCINGKQADTGWFEIYPSTPNTQETFRNFPVGPGDVMLAKIEINADDEWTTVLENLTTGLQGVFSVGYEWDVATIANNTLVGSIQGTATGTSYSGADSAEWVTEDPGVAYSSSMYPFANFGTVTFSNLITNLSSWTLPGGDAVEIVQGGETLSVPGPVANDGFTVGYTGP